MISWTKPDGTHREIVTLDHYIECLAEIDDLRVQALLEQRTVDAAKLAAEHRHLFKSFVGALKTHLAEVGQEAEQFANKARLMKDWWQDLYESAASIEPPVEVSAAQAAILNEGRMTHHSWSQARATLDEMEDYMPPASIPLETAIARLEPIFARDTELGVAIVDCLMAIAGFGDDFVGWERFRSEIYPRFESACSAFNAAAEALYAGA